MLEFPSILSVPLLARYLHLKPSKVMSMVRRNEIPYARLSERIVVFYRQVIDCWLIESTKGHGAMAAKRRALDMQRYASLAGRPLTASESAMLGRSEKDIAKGRVVPL